MSTLNFDPRPWKIVAASIAVHGTVFTLLHTIVSRTVFGKLYNKLSKREQMRFDERFVAMVHACISCQGSIRAFFSVLPSEITVDNIVEVSGAYAFVFQYFFLQSLFSYSVMIIVVVVHWTVTILRSGS